MNRVDLERRTKQFAISALTFVRALPPDRAIDVLARQLLRSATSIGANYREANRAESRADFVHKIGLVEKEAAETEYWLELLRDAGLSDGAAIDSLLSEAQELLRIFCAANRTAKANKSRKVATGR